MMSHQPGPDEHVTIAPSILYFGTPVVLLSTVNHDGSANLAPMSSAWALGQVVVLGLGTGGQTAHNLAARPDMVINLPSPRMWSQVERLAPLTGRESVPEHKRGVFRHVHAKFEAAGLSPVDSDVSAAPRVAECPIQLEAAASSIRPGDGGGFVIVEARVLRVHADPSLVVSGTQHIDPQRWSPLIYNFRHYFGLGEQLGHSFRSQTPAPPVSATGRGSARSPRPGRAATTS